MRRAPLVTKVLCVALVASVMLPVGRVVYPAVAGAIDGMQFDAAEAVLSATLGFAIYAAVFG